MAITIPVLWSKSDRHQAGIMIAITSE